MTVHNTSVVINIPFCIYEQEYVGYVAFAEPAMYLISYRSGEINNCKGFTKAYKIFCIAIIGFQFAAFILQLRTFVTLV